MAAALPGWSMSVISDLGMRASEPAFVWTTRAPEVLRWIFASSSLPLVREIVAVVEQPQIMMDTSNVTVSFVGMDGVPLY